MAKDFEKLRRIVEDLQKDIPRAVRLPDSQEGPFQEWSDSLNALRRDYEPPPVSPHQNQPAQQIKSDQQARSREEIDFAIESAAKELREDSELTRDKLHERLFGPEDKRAAPLKNKKWATDWTESRFRKKIWKPARERAGLSPLAPKGRRPEK